MAARRARSSSADSGEGEASARPRKKPRDFALARLGRRAHSVFELERKMERAGYTGEEIRVTVEFLRERRYLDDASFARDYARSAAEHKKWGPRRIERVLKELGVATPLIDEAVTEAFAEGEAERASAVLTRFLRSRRRDTDWRRARARAYRHLLSRGFSPDVVHRLVSSDDFEDTDSLDEP